jgi:hypothetical protein
MLLLDSAYVFRYPWISCTACEDHPLEILIFEKSLSFMRNFDNDMFLLANIGKVLVSIYL